MAAYVKRTQRRMGDVNKPLIIVYDALLSDSKIPVRGSKDGVQTMPAIITHDTFGQDAYARHFSSIGGTKDEAEAFLLGNQGPDPLFYSIANPLLSSVHRLGNIMHKEKPNEILVAFKQAIDALDEADRSVGRAYALGFLGHYVLDSTMHPLVYFHEFQLCDAGEPGLSRADGNEVHAVIESEYDEMVLTVKRGETVATFNPAVNILKGSDRMLRIVSLLYANMAFSVFGKIIPRNAFGDSVRCFRLVQHLFHSGSGVKREAIARIEELVRPYSFYRAMSHRADPGGNVRVRQPRARRLGEPLHAREIGRQLLGPLREGAAAFRRGELAVRRRRLQRGDGARHHARPQLLRRARRGEAARGGVRARVRQSAFSKNRGLIIS